MLAPLAHLQDQVLLTVRLVLGTVMVYYGLQKVRDPAAGIKEFNAKGYRPGWFFNILSILIELGGGLGVLFGVLTWLAAAGFGGEMILGAAWKITKGKRGFGDWSYDLLCLALCLVLLAHGPGRFAL